MEDTQQTIWDRAGLVAVLLLVVAFLFSALSPLVATAGADDQFVGKRDDDGGDVVAVDDDDDDDDDQADDDSGENPNGDTATGTTQGTGASANSVSLSGS